MMQSYKFLHDASLAFPNLATVLPFEGAPVEVHNTMALTHTRGPLAHLIQDLAATVRDINGNQRRLLARIIQGTNLNEEFASGTGYMTYLDPLPSDDQRVIKEIAEALINDPQIIHVARHENVPGLAEWVVVNAMLSGWKRERNDENCHILRTRFDLYLHCMNEAERLIMIEQREKVA